MEMDEKSVLGPFWGLASNEKVKQLQSAKELILLLRNSQVLILSHTHYNVSAPLVSSCYLIIMNSWCYCDWTGFAKRYLFTFEPYFELQNFMSSI